MAKIENKDRVLFWLKRRERTLAAQPMTHEAMAHSGMSYSARRDALEHAEQLADSQRTELESLRAAIAFIEENADG